MQKNNPLFKILITVFAISMIAWSAGKISGLTIAYDLFKPGSQLEYKEWYSNEFQLQSLHLFAFCSLYSDIGFPVAFSIILFLLIIERKNMLKRGWLFMSVILFLLASPIEFYLIYLNINLNEALSKQTVVFFLQDETVKKYFLSRFLQLNVPMVLSTLFIFTGFIFFIWRPLDKSGVETVKSAK